MIEVPYVMFDSRDYAAKDFWSDVAKMIELLTRYNYDVLISYEDCGLYRISYTHADLSLGAPKFEVVSADEAEMLWDLRNNKEVENDDT